MKPITKQEKKILKFIGNGYSSSQIATALAISEHTVESHRKSLLAKFGAKNSPELIRIAIQHEELTADKKNHNITPNIDPDEDKS